MDLRTTIAVTCTFAAVFVAVAWSVRKSMFLPWGKKKKRNEREEIYEEIEFQETRDQTISALPNPRWVWVGRVEDLFIHPLKSGRGRRIDNCFFGIHGLIECNENMFPLRDRTLIVYKEDSGHFQTGKNHPKLVLVNVTSVDENSIMLEAPGMSRIIIDLCNNPGKQGKVCVHCIMWYNDPIKCIDCGPEAAKWISMYLIGKKNGFRLAYAIQRRKDILNGPLKRYYNAHNLRNEDFGLCSDFANYMIMSVKSMEALNEKVGKAMSILQFRPTIVVSGCEAFTEVYWEWIKIGERAVIRQVKQCARCAMIRIDPETGCADEEEPTKTLRTFLLDATHCLNRFRSLTDPKRVYLEGNSSTIGIYCGLYVAGRVKVGDDVYIHVP